MNETVQTTIKINQDTWMKLDEYCTQNGILKQFALAEAIREYLDKKMKVKK